MPTQDGLGVTVMTCRTGATPATAATDCDQTTKQWPPDTNGDAQSTGTVGTVDLERFPYWLSRTIILAGQPIDCAVTPGCVLLAKDGGGDVYGVAPLDFDPRAPSLPPVITVSTREDLHNGQMITIRGRNFTPSLTYGGQAFYVGVCVIDTQTCDSLGFEPGTPIRIGLKGTFSITYRVWSAFESRGSSGWDLQDCLSTTCAVAVGVLGTNGGAERIPGVPDIPLSFAPGTRALNPRITTDPLSPYQPGQQVTVTLHDFPFPMRGAEFMYPRGPNLALCDAATLCAEGTLPLTRDPSDDGRYTATFVAQPSITLPNGQPADCTQPGDCVIALHSGFALTSGGGLYPANRMDLLTVDFLVVG